jgi:hypothetical protein
MEELRAFRSAKYTLRKFGSTNSKHLLHTVYDEPEHSYLNVSLIGGAYEAVDLDAKRAFNLARYLAAVV